MAKSRRRTYSPGCDRPWKKDPVPQRVVLINGKRLIELMVEHGVGGRTSRTVEFKRLDEDFSSEKY
jgi:restriction endonuclease Mrr